MTDLSVRVGQLALPNPVMTASGTAGHGAELGAYGDLSALGAVVVKSLAAFPWEGNPPLRVVPAAAGMINSVGLTGPGVESWTAGHLPDLQRAGARVVASIWGREVGEYRQAARQLAEADSHALIAVEVNVSCPNTEDRGRMFAQSPSATGEVIAAVVEVVGLPVWAKLTPALAALVEVAGAALDAGAAALTLVNTMPAMAIDTEEARPALGGVTGGLSGPALHPIALRCVYECRAAFPDAALVGVGGVTGGRQAVAMIMAGADALQVGTATFADPRAPWKVLDEIEDYCHRHGVATIAELKGVAQK